VTKKDIVRIISEEVGLTQQQTKRIVQKTFDAIIEALVRDGRIELRNFGVFEAKARAARKARNPRTGHQVEVPAKHVVTFKPGKEMELRVRRIDAEAKASKQERNRLQGDPQPASLAESDGVVPKGSLDGRPAAEEANSPSQSASAEERGGASDSGALGSTPGRWGLGPRLGSAEVT
jgi:integration host factor subunit beta